MNAEPTNREIAAVARKAAEIILQRGKATGVLDDEQGRVCALYALVLAERAVGVVGGEAVCLRCEAAVAAPWPVARPRGLAAWSDRPTTTEQGIAAVFLQVADDLEAAR